MKLSPVLSRFLAANKQLSLPGIGTFYSEGAYSPDVDSKKPAMLNNVTFRQENVEKVDDGLIDFISKDTGKMKVLAESDLSSQLGDVLTFINTGKPYFFAGIGTLAKKQNGSFEFFPEKYSPVQEKKKERDVPITEKNFVPQSYIDNTKAHRRSARPAIIIIILSLIAIGATVWFYMKNQEPAVKEPETVASADTEQQVVTDSNITKRDSSITPVSTVTSANTYTYILEEAKEPRASKRFNQLKQINWPVELEVVDSTYKRIVMKLPRAGVDTARIKDSLRVLNGRRVFIAQ